MLYVNVMELNMYDTYGQFYVTMQLKNLILLILSDVAKTTYMMKN